jgi:hypothetical protein
MQPAIWSQSDRAARLAAIPAGEIAVISSDGEGDRSVASLEVKVPEGWGVPVPIRTGGQAAWQTAAEANQ